MDKNKVMHINLKDKDGQKLVQDFIVLYYKTTNEMLRPTEALRVAFTKAIQSICPECYAEMRVKRCSCKDDNFDRADLNHR